MTRDEIIKLAHQADLLDEGHYGSLWAEKLVWFATAVAEKEREACAELVWPKLKIWTPEEQTAMSEAFEKAQARHGWYETMMAVGAAALKPKAAAIRARGNA